MRGRKPNERLTVNQCSRCKHPSPAEPGKRRCKQCQIKNNKYLHSEPVKSKRAITRKQPAIRKRNKQNDKAYRDRHFFRVRAYQVNWRNSSNITAQQLAKLWHDQKGVCALSGERLTAQNAHLDHILSRSVGGPTTISNLRWLHEVVNHAKWTFTDVDFILFCRKIVAYADLR